MNIADIINSGMLKIAHLPPENPKGWGNNKWTIFLIEHDYPGQSPKIWNTVYSKLAWPFRTVMLVGNPEKVLEILSVFRQDEQYLGGGLGIGFKDEAIKKQALDSLAQSAELVQAANVITKKNGRLVGHNTDGIGYLRSLEEKFLEMGKEDLSRANVMILGAGGTANAIAFALAPKVKSIFIVNRTESKAEKLAKMINSFCKEQKARFGGESAIKQIAPEVEVIINASTKGATGKLACFSALAETDSLEKNLRDSESVLTSLKKDALISDVNLTIGEPTLIRMARKSGFPTLNGKPMVVFQAIEAFCLVHHSDIFEKNISKKEIETIMQGLVL